MQVNGVAVVVGAGNEIGRAVALRLAYFGADVVVCADLKIRDALTTEVMCKNVQRPDDLEHLKTDAVQLDVFKETTIGLTLDKIIEKYGRIDILVNTIGFAITTRTSILHMEIPMWYRTYGIYTHVPFLLTRNALRYMNLQAAIKPTSPAFSSRPPTRGAIVLVTPLASEGTYMGAGDITAANYATKGMVKTAAVETAARGIRVNAVATFPRSSPRIHEPNTSTLPIDKNVPRDLPMGRFAETDEVADAVVFLASSASSYVNGQTLVVDGGASLQLLDASPQQYDILRRIENRMTVD